MTAVLIIEDEVNLNKILSDYLRHNGFQPVSAHTGKEGLDQWQTARPSLVLLDLNLPDMDGLDVARAIRKSTQTPIIMVTARQEELDCLIGLELGADDYISKPFSPREVVARVKAVLRRCMIQSHGEGIIQLGAIGIDLEARTVMLNDTLLNLTPRNTTCSSNWLANLEKCSLGLSCFKQRKARVTRVTNAPSTSTSKTYGRKSGKPTPTRSISKRSPVRVIAP